MTNTNSASAHSPFLVLDHWQLHLELLHLHHLLLERLDLLEQDFVVPQHLCAVQLLHLWGNVLIEKGEIFPSTDLLKLSELPLLADDHLLQELLLPRRLLLPAFLLVLLKLNITQRVNKFSFSLAGEHSVGRLLPALCGQHQE